MFEFKEGYDISFKPEIDFDSWFYKNCKRARKRQYKCCNSCPFKEYIELLETFEKNKGVLSKL